MGEDRSTEGLIGEVLKANPDAFPELFRRYQGRIEMWISLRMGPLLRAKLTGDDVLQETFLEAYRSLDKFKDQGRGSFNRWLLSVAENRIRDLHRYHTAQKRDPGRERPGGAATDEEEALLGRLAASGTSPSSGARRKELVGRMIEIIPQLPEAQRDVLVQRALEERTLKEIAQRRGERPSSVQAHYAQALQSLKERMRGGSGTA
jgi:RNA polymerase sigma-70 factor (ECF subfamily)